MVVGFLTPQRNAMTLAAKVGMENPSKIHPNGLQQDVNSTFVGLYRQVGFGFKGDVGRSCETVS